jgi:two-component system, OmpR family, sensor kinase
VIPFRRSLRNRLALLFFTITLVAIGGLYLYVAPGLQTRLMNEKLAALATAVRQHSTAIVATVGRPISEPQVKTRVDDAAAAAGERVTLLSVERAAGGTQLFQQADSSNPGGAGPLPLIVAKRAVKTGTLATGTTSDASGPLAQAAYPVFFGGRVVKVIVFSAGVSDIVQSTAIVHHEILVAGGIALLLALCGGYLVARALAQRVKRLELAVESVAAGNFEHPIRVDSRDELGQLAVAFNDMQRQLAQLDSARKKFIATASHELRTPIFSLGGFVELLEDEELDPETRQRFLEQVKDQVERLRKLSVDLLDLSRLEAGSLELRPEHVDLRELTRSVSDEFEPTLAQHDSHMEVRLPQRRVEAVCDPVRVAQIMRILIDNAVTHTPPGTRITVTAGRDNGRVRLAVRDNGDGIDARAMSRIFEPFYTADDAQGSGLGLAIASELAERMHGNLTARSSSGDTVFTLEIP